MSFPEYGMSNGRKALWAASIVGGAAILNQLAGTEQGPPSTNDVGLSYEQLAENLQELQAAPEASGQWRLSAQEDFNGSTLDPDNWFVYRRQPAGGNGLWRESQATVGDGLLTLTTEQGPDGRWISGGVGQRYYQQYGKWEIRARFDAGTGVRGVALLWPKSGWPPEIDFAESGGNNVTPDPATPDRNSVHLASHYWCDEKPNHNCQVIDDVTPPDDGTLTTWHTIGVEITPDKVGYTMDGQVTATHTGKAVPHQPLRFGVQQALGLGNEPQPDATTPDQVKLQVDWLKIYEFVPES